MRYLITPTQNIQAMGLDLTTEDTLGVIETDLPVHEVLAMLRFKHAALVEEVADDLEDQVDDDGEDDIVDQGDIVDVIDEDLVDDEDQVDPLGNLPDKIKNILRNENILTLVQAATKAAEHGGSLEYIDGIGPKMDQEILAAIQAAGFRA